MEDNTPYRDDSAITLLKKIVAMLGGNPDCCAGNTEQQLLFMWAEQACSC